jgi:hypothetical protein
MVASSLLLEGERPLSDHLAIVCAASEQTERRARESLRCILPIDSVDIDKAAQSGTPPSKRAGCAFGRSS